MKVRRKDQFERKHGGGYDEAEFSEHPERYISTFAHKIAPYASVIVNGIYWSPETPRLLTIPDAKSLITPVNSPWMATTKGMKHKLNLLKSLELFTFHFILHLMEIYLLKSLILRFSKSTTSIDRNL